MGASTNYEPKVIEIAAQRLNAKAGAVVAGSITMGVLLGAAFGSVPLTSLGASWPIPSSFGFATILVGALVGAAIGYVVGDSRALGYRYQAQSALCQLQVERNTAAAAEAAERLNLLAARLAGTRSAQVEPPPVRLAEAFGGNSAQSGSRPAS